MVLIGYIGALAYGVICLLLSMVAYKLGMPKKYTRKIVHILVGAEWFILYHTVGVSLHFIAVCLIFTALVWVSYAKSLMPMISSENDNAPGTVYYCISMTVMAIVSRFLPTFALPFGVAVLCTSVGDGFACVIGSSVKRANPKVYQNKTLFGTLSSFLFSFVSVAVFAYAYGMPLSVLDAAIVAAFASGLELITGRGLDNITIPLCSAAFTWFLAYADGAYGYVIPILLTPYVIAFALGAGILTPRAIIFAVVADIAVSVSLGNFGFTLLLAFLLLSVVIDKIKKRKTAGEDGISEKGDCRDGMQVMANAIAPAICAVLYLITKHPAFVVAYCAALAEAFADTAASGMGAFSRGAFDPFRMKAVERGLSGGMSIPGTLASLAAPMLISLIPLAFGVIDATGFIIAALAGFIGAVFDSMLGSLVQAKYKCGVCGKITEKRVHCQEKTEHISGIGFINNDAVNVASTVFAAAAALAVCFILK